jgi:YD repeat-containing protein
MTRILAFLLVLASLAAHADVDYAYDAAGRLVGVWAPNGDAAQYVYDAAGNITEIKRINSGSLAIIEFSPLSGLIGSTVTIWGNGFSTTPANNTVTFNGTGATVSSAAANKLVVTVPTGATTGPIGVTVSSNTATTTKNFTVTGTTSCTGGFSGISPTIGVASTSVTITGSGFNSTRDTAQFNGLSGAITGATSTTLTTTVPSGATSGRLLVSLPPDCGPQNAGDFFVPPSGFTAADIGATGRLTINGSTTNVTLAAGKKALYVFDVNAGDGAGAYLTSSTLGNVTVEIRAPDGSVVSTASFSSATGQSGPAYLRATGGYSIFINPTSGTAGSATLRLGAPDLVISSASAGTVTANQNGSFNVPASFTVTNSGTVTATPNWTDYGYLGTGPLFDPLVKSIGSTIHTSSLAPSSSYNVSQTYAVSGIAPGTYTLFMRADSNGGGAADPFGFVVESNELNNMASVSITLPTYPDLAASSPSVGTVTVNQNGSYTFTTSFVVTNLGTNQALASWSDYAYLSSNGVLDSNSVILGSNLRATNLAGGANYTFNKTITTSGVSPGNYTVFLKADGLAAGGQAGNGVVAESSETNNVVSASITLPTYPDLTVTSPSIGTITENQNGTYNIPVTFTVNNTGASAAQPSWTDFGYLSSNGVLDASSTSIGQNFRSTALAASSNYVVSKTMTTPTSITPGTYTLFFKADGQTSGTAAGVLTEADETNNTASVASMVLPAYPDLVISNPSVGTIVKNANGTYNIPVTYTVTNSGGSPAQPNWNDFGYLSSNGSLDASSASIGSQFRGTALAVNGNYTVTKTFVTAVVSAGNYTVFVKTDAQSNATLAGFVVESNESNNATAGLSVTLP